MKVCLPLDTVDYLLKRKENVTEYERAHGITCTGAEVIADYGDIKFYAVQKSDGSKTLSLVFRVGLSSDAWLIWHVTEKQAIILSNFFPGIYEKINKANMNRRLQPNAKASQ